MAMVQDLAPLTQQRNAVIDKPLGQQIILSLKLSGYNSEGLAINQTGGCKSRLHSVESPAQIDGGWSRSSESSDGTLEVVPGLRSKNDSPGRSNADRGSTTDGHGRDGDGNLVPCLQLHKHNGPRQLSLIEQLQVFSGPAKTGRKDQCRTASVSCIEEEGIPGL
jgi:hypothetical protein